MTTHDTDARSDVDRLVAVDERGDILPAYRGTPIETLLAHHNLAEPSPRPADPQLIVVTCIDFRIALDLPEAFAFVIRTAGANVEPVIFNVTCAMAFRPVRAVAIIGHSDCAMVDVERHHKKFVDLVTDLGPLTKEDAEALFEAGVDQFGCADAVVHTRRQCAVLRRLFDDMVIAPLYFDVDDGRLYQIVAPACSNPKSVVPNP